MNRLIEKFIVEGKPSVFIELPNDEVFFSDGLVDFSACLGIASRGANLNLFEYDGQLMTLRLVSADAFNVTYDQYGVVINYDSIDGLDDFLRNETKHFHRGEVNPLMYVNYNEVSDLWSYYGTGYKKEAYLEQYMDFSVMSEERTKAALKAICLFALRMGIYSNSIHLPVMNNMDSRASLTLKHSDKEELTIDALQNFILTGRNLPEQLVSLTRLKHFGDGGVYGLWQLHHQVSETQEYTARYEWHGDSEATRILDATADLSGDIEVYITASSEDREDFKKILMKQNPNLNDVKVYSAFKPAYFWLLEEVLSQYESVETIEITVKNSSTDGGMELSNRWLLEIYPVDEVIAKKYGISSDDISFSIAPELENSYEVLINGEDQFGFTPLVDEMKYLDEVHTVSPVSAGYRWNSEAYIVETDRKRFYRFVIEEVFPQIVSQLDIHSDTDVSQTLFDRISIHYAGSSVEDKPPFQNEVISSNEALYEDLYFNGLDYFNHLGMKLLGQPFKSPGGIVPYINETDEIFGQVTGEVKFYEKCERAQQQKVTAINFNGQDIVSLTTGAGTEDINSFAMPSITSDLETLRSSDVKLSLVRCSYQNRPIYAVECFKRNAEYYSGLKITKEKPTVVIETGHHANEVSSIPAGIKLIKTLKSEQCTLLDDMNVIFIIDANPDGHALLKELIESEPEWKHHAARFNAVGLEFAHFKFMDSMYGEAEVLPDILKKWAPDIIIDNHGIPAHEWAQPFTGYSTPKLFPVSYNIPSAKVYGIGRYNENKDQETHRKNLDIISSTLNNKFKGTSFEAENELWRNVFYKYGTQFVPDKFPIEGKGSINFYKSISVTPEYPTVSIFRYPDWIAADVISEVADEVVQGEELESCIEAQYLFNLSILELVAKQNLEYHGKTRIRPLQLKERDQ